MVRTEKEIDSQTQKDFVNQIKFQRVKETKLKKVELWKNLQFETDFVVVLRWKTKPDENFCSKLGLIICSFLKEFGLISHSVWKRI